MSTCAWLKVYVNIELATAIVFSKQCDWLCNIYIIFRLEIVLAVIVYHCSFIVVNVLVWTILGNAYVCMWLNTRLQTHSISLSLSPLLSLSLSLQCPGMVVVQMGAGVKNACKSYSYLKLL